MAIPGLSFKTGLPTPACLAKPRLPCHTPVSLQSYSAPSGKARITKREETLMIDQQIDIPTKDGKTTTFISHPERGGWRPRVIT
jgi:hypothetical protein